MNSVAALSAQVVFLVLFFLFSLSVATEVQNSTDANTKSVQFYILRNFIVNLIVNFSTNFSEMKPKINPMKWSDLNCNRPNVS